MLKSIMTRRRFGLLAATATLTAGQAATAQPLPLRMVLDWHLQGQQSPFVMAVDAGFFSRAGVAASVDGSNGSADAISKLASGAYDLAVADLGAVMQFNARQAATKVISVFQYYDVAPMIIMALRKSGIRTVADLAGRTLGGSISASSRVMMPLLASANGLDLNSITWINVSPQMRDTLLLTGKYDAVPAQITDVASLTGLNIKADDIEILRFSDNGVDIYGHAVITTPEFAARHPDTVRASLRAIAAAIKATLAEPSAAILALKNREPLTDEAIERERLNLSIANAVMSSRVEQNGLSAVIPQRLRRTADLVSKAFDIEKIDLENLYKPDFLPSKRELALSR